MKVFQPPFRACYGHVCFIFVFAWAVCFVPPLAATEIAERVSELEQEGEAVYAYDLRLAKSAARDLVEQGDPGVEALRSLVESSERYRARILAARVLFEHTGNDSLLDEIMRALEHEHWRVTTAAARHLREVGIGSDEIVDHLLQRLAGEPDDEHKEVLLRVIGEQGGEAVRAVEPLLVIHADETNSLTLRLRALKTAGMVERALDNRTVTDAPERPIPLERWTSALADESIGGFVRLYWDAVDRFRSAESDEAVPVLTEALRSGPPAIRSRAAGLLADRGELTAPVRAALLGAVRDEAWYVRWEAVEALRELGVPDSDIEVVAGADLDELTTPPAAADAAPVTVEADDDAGRLYLDNGLVRVALTTEHPSSQVASVMLGGEEMWREMYFDHPGVYFRFGHHAPTDYEIVRDDGDIAHVRFFIPDPDNFPAGLDMQVNFVMKRGVSGFYPYMTYRHVGDEPFRSSVKRHVIRVQPELLHSDVVDDRRQGNINARFDTEHRPPMNNLVPYRLHHASPYDKYGGMVIGRNHGVHGMGGERHGVWQVKTSNEYVNAGPAKQSNTIHDILLRVVQSTHHVGDQVDLNPESGWEKMYGPSLIYINSGENRAEVWVDAKRRLREERAQWAYSWVDEPLYEGDRRSTVSGRLVLEDGTPAAGATVILAEPDPDWQLQAGDYMFWTETDPDGRFEIDSVRPNEYTLYAKVSGILNEFRRDGVEVAPSDSIDLGEMAWPETRRGDKVWEIGVPDRTAGEFYIPGGRFREWGMWYEYKHHFPEGVAFVVGESDYRRDWNYFQPARVPEGDGTWGHRDAEPWRIRFTLEDAPASGGVLTLAVAGAGPHDGNLEVLVNGEPAERFDLPPDGRFFRQIRGRYSKHVVEIEPGLLRGGENTIELNVHGRNREYGVMYDYLRFETP